MPSQAQPQHILEDRELYRRTTQRQVQAIQLYMDKRPGVFTPEHKTSMYSLLSTLSSNLADSTKFDWSPAELTTLYSNHRYDTDQRCSPDQPAQNLFQQEIERAAAPAPDGMRDPASFQAALDRGLVDQYHVHNVQACILKKDKFYVQRPHPEDTEPFRIVKVVRVIPDPQDDSIQWGAWVQRWECAVDPSEDRDYFRDPYHGVQKTPQQFNNSNGDFGQQRWTFDRCPLTAFQDYVDMTKKWTRPRQWDKLFTGGAQQAHGVLRRGINQQKSAKVIRNHVLRWQRADDDA